MIHPRKIARTSRMVQIAGYLMPILFWLFVKYVFSIPDRWLPSPFAVLAAIRDINPNIVFHFLATAIRLLVGFSAGVSLGIALGLATSRFRLLDALFTPAIQSLRSIPAAAAVPFFLLWFGFSEVGKFLLIFSTVAFNVGIAVNQIVATVPERHAVLFHSYQKSPSDYVWYFALPHVLEKILPTLRFSLAIVIGAEAVSEILGSQIGLGYLIQTARATFSLHLLFLAMFLFGVLSTCGDYFLCLLWRFVVYWSPSPQS